MDDLERRYKVKLRKKYEKDREIACYDIQKSCEILATLAGCGALCLIAGLPLPLVILSFGYPLYINVRSLVSSIVKKTCLEMRIEDIDVEFAKYNEAGLDMQNGNFNNERSSKRR